jgi:hypothetical protein
MTKNTVQVFQLLLLFLAFVAGGSWCVTKVQPVILWGLRIGTPLAGIVVGLYFYKLSRRPDMLPDLLRDAAGKYFERDGFCFALLVDQINGVCRLNIYFQNRYAGHASAKVKMLPPLRTLGLGRHPLPKIEVAVECPGGAFGVLRMPFPIPGKYQGKRMTFNPGADVRYRRRGKLLRFRSGRNVPSTAQTGQSGWGIIGAIRIAAQANAKLQLPTNVGSESSGLIAQTEIIWAPDPATHGFPILPAKTAA